MDLPQYRHGFSIHGAGEDDVDDVAELFDAYRQFYDQPGDLPAARAYIAERVRNNESSVFLARETSGRAVGFTQLYPTFCSVEAKPIMVLYDLYVAPAVRRHGVAQALLATAEQHGRERGVARVDLQTARTNAPAQALYESRGWRRDNVFYAYSLRL